MKTIGRTSVNLTLAIAAASALCLGLLVYWTDRDTARPALIPPLPALAHRHWFGATGGWLPSFVHVFGFSLLTVAVGGRDRSTGYGACAVWVAIDVALEAGQHPALSPRLAQAIHALGDGPVARTLADYFVLGTFDPADVMAACGGGVVAAIVLAGLRAPSDRPTC